MPGQNLVELERAVIAASVANTWSGAVTEWDVIALEEDPAGDGVCTCGHTDLVKLFTIANRLNNNVLFPIGSVCVNHFGRSDLNQQVNVLDSLLKLRSAIQDGKAIELTTAYFSRAVLDYLADSGAFVPDEYNGGDGWQDHRFLTKMFNKRNKDDITAAQRKKVWALLHYKVRPFVLEDPRLGGSTR